LVEEGAGNYAILLFGIKKDIIEYGSQEKKI